MTKSLKKRGGAVTGSFWDRFKSQQQLENDAKAEATRWEASQLKHEQSEKDKLIEEQKAAVMDEVAELEQLRKEKEERYGGKKSRKQKKNEKRRKTRRVKKSNK